jgi:hypothetical protein
MRKPLLDRKAFAIWLLLQACRPNRVWHSINQEIWYRGKALDLYSLSNLGRDTGYPDRRFSRFSSVPPGKFFDVNSIRPWPLPSKSFRIHYSPIIPILNAKNVRYWQCRKVNVHIINDRTVGFEFLTAVTMETMVCVVATCSLTEVYRHSGGTYCLQLCLQLACC